MSYNTGGVPTTTAPTSTLSGLNSFASLFRDLPTILNDAQIFQAGQQAYNNPGQSIQAPPMSSSTVQWKQDPTTGQWTSYNPQIPQPGLTRPAPTPQVNPYANMYQAPGYTQGYVTGAADNPATISQNQLNQARGYSPVSEVNLPVPVAPDYNQATNATGGDITQKSRATLQEVFGGANKDLYTQYVDAINNGRLPVGQRNPKIAAIEGGDPMSEQGFRNFATSVTGSGALPSEKVSYAPRTAPVTIPAQTLINNNRGLYDMWNQMTRPSDPMDVNAFARWAADNGYPTLVGESKADQFKAYQAAKAEGTLAPAAPQTAPATAPVTITPAATTPAITTPTFRSTGAVKIPTATVTPTRTTTTTAPTGPSRPGYVAPSGRVYANWAPKKKA